MTKQIKNNKLDRPAGTEFEITQEMIEAGRDVIAFYSAAGEISDEAEDFLFDVVVAMLECPHSTLTLAPKLPLVERHLSMLSDRNRLSFHRSFRPQSEQAVAPRKA